MNSDKTLYEVHIRYVRMNLLCITSTHSTPHLTFLFVFSSPAHDFAFFQLHTPSATIAKSHMVTRKELVRAPGTLRSCLVDDTLRNKLDRQAQAPVKNHRRQKLVLGDKLDKEQHMLIKKVSHNTTSAA